MGIKGLHNVIKKYAEDAYVKKHLSEYAYKKIAVDISLYIFKYKAIFGDRWINSFINLIAVFRKNEIHCVFVFDGKAPEEKDAEKQARMEQREKLRDKISNIEFLLSEYHSSGEIHDDLKKIYEDNAEESDKVSLLKISNRKNFDIKVVENYLMKIKSQVISISKEDIQLVQQMFKLLHVPYIQSPYEAETFCAQLCVRGLVDCVTSEDTDVLAYGTPVFLTKVNLAEESGIEINFDKLMDLLGMNWEQFRDLCIMCGTDYNANIKGIGPDKSYKLLVEHKSIEEIAKVIDKKTMLPKFDTTVLNYQRTRELFSVPENMDVVVEFCGRPDFEEVQKFFFKNSIRVNMDYIKKCFAPPEIVFED